MRRQMRTNRVLMNQAGTLSDSVRTDVKVHFDLVETQDIVDGVPDLEFSFGNSTHNFEVYVVDDQAGGTLLRSEQLQVLDGDTGAVLYDSGSFTNFTGGVYYKWSVTGHVKVKVINTSTNGTVAVINGVFFNS